ASGARAPRDPAIDRQAVAGNLAWAALSFALGKLAALASLILLARLLTPRAFGAVTIVLTAVTFLEVAGRVGLNTALIYQPADAGADGIAPAADAVFWFWMATACLEAVAAWLGAPAVAAFFRQPLVTPMLRVMAPALLVTALGATHDTLLRRALRFRKKLAPDLGLALAKAGASVALALAHWGAWSLIGGQWAGAVAGTALLWWVVPWRPRRRWAPLLARQLLAYGKHIYALDLSGIVLANLDYLVVARMLGATALGFYYLAFRLPEALLISVLNVITGVVFPAFSRLHADPPRLRAAVLETERYAVLFALPMAAALALLARPLVLAFYGRHWLPAVPVLQVLALYAAIRCLSHHFGDAYKALGKPQILSALTVVWWLLLPPALVLGARWDGLVGVAWGQVATRAAMTAVHFVLIVRVVGIAPGRLARALAPALEGTLALAMAILAVRPLAAPLPAWPALLLPAGAGAAAYGLLLWLRHREVCLGAWLVTRELLARRGIRVAGSGHASA
ncbi:MAG: lipopolysaccharide biosynthesis protein, partial [Terriglobales bacterium]